MADKEYFFQGYVGNRKLKEEDFSKYTMKQLKNMMKAQAKRLNTRLASLEKGKMTGGYAYRELQTWAFDEKEGVHTRNRTPRFETRVSVYEASDGGEYKIRDRTRAEIIEQLINMGKWESYRTSTVSGMMATYEAKHKELSKKGINVPFEDYVSMATTDAFSTIAKYYGESTAETIINEYGESAADAFISQHPDYFQKANPLNGQGLTLELIFDDWYQANWEHVTELVESEEDFINSF